MQRDDLLELLHLVGRDGLGVHHDAVVAFAAEASAAACSEVLVGVLVDRAEGVVVRERALARLVGEFIRRDRSAVSACGLERRGVATAA